MRSEFRPIRYLFIPLYRPDRLRTVFFALFLFLFVGLVLVFTNILTNCAIISLDFLFLLSKRLPGTLFPPLFSPYLAESRAVAPNKIPLYGPPLPFRFLSFSNFLSPRCNFLFRTTIILNIWVITNRIRKNTIYITIINIINRCFIIVRNRPVTCPNPVIFY